MSVKMNVPASATIDDGDGIKKVQYFRLRFHVDADGTISVPRWLAAELAARGCSYADPATAPKPASIRDHLAAVPEELTHEVSQFLNAHGVADHYFEANTHALSDMLRAAGQGAPRMVPNPGAPDGCAKEYELFTAAAAELDRLHQMFCKKFGRGRPVVLSHDEKTAKALELADRLVGKI